ncbi:MAG: hypothetical protein N2C14_23270 [Planctomycetales bacterium]
MPRFACLVTAALMIAASNSAYSQSSSSESYSSQAPEDKATQIARNKLKKYVDAAFRRARPANRGGKKKEADFFVLGLAQITKTNRAADVKFFNVSGVDSATDKVVDYMMETPEDALRNWKLFARYNGGSDAENTLGTIRTQFDQLQNYRAKMMAAYKAKSICRS